MDRIHQWLITSRVFAKVDTLNVSSACRCASRKMGSSAERIWIASREVAGRARGDSHATATTTRNIRRGVAWPPSAKLRAPGMSIYGNTGRVCGVCGTRHRTRPPVNIRKPQFQVKAAWQGSSDLSIPVPQSIYFHVRPTGPYIGVSE